MAFMKNIHLQRYKYSNIIILLLTYASIDLAKIFEKIDDNKEQINLQLIF
jgi:hypothetical protein